MTVDTEILLKAYRLMCLAREMANTYEQNRQICKYVHSTSKGHEAIQLATAFNLQAIDFVSPYYRDESIMLGLGFDPSQLMMQLLAKSTDIFTGGREYYNHPNFRGEGKPTIIHQSSATGMQAIPTTGIAQGLKYLNRIQSSLLRKNEAGELPIVICSLGDASVTEGEVSEAFQFAALHQLPIIFLVQDNDWGISVTSKESRTANAYRYIKGFKGIKRVSVNGSDFEASYITMKKVIDKVREKQIPYLVHATVPLLGHHTSGVRKEFYRNEEEFALQSTYDPLPLLKIALTVRGIPEDRLLTMEEEAKHKIAIAFEEAVAAPEPDPETVSDHVFAPPAITEEKGERAPAGNQKVMMVDAALFAIREIMEEFPEAVLYGQDVGKRLGGVFRETATIGEQFGDHRVFNTAIQEAYIIGSTVGMSAVGAKPIVEVQFADYIYPGINQLVTEISKSCYLSCGKFPIQTLIRVPTGAYGGGGPYHSGSVETTLLSIKGIKVVYPSNAADMKGLMKAAFLDPNPVVMLEHKGLYWSKVPGTEEAKTIEPSSDYVIPLGKGKLVLEADEELIEDGDSCVIITYGMGVYWSLEAAKTFGGRISLVDLRSLYPLDEELIYSQVRIHGKCLVLTEEQKSNSFAEALAGKISMNCFNYLDVPVAVVGSLDLPAVPMNIGLESAMLPNAEKLTTALDALFRK
ncbi:MAG: tungsten formylmethanofuran dehydrogenase [Chitinophagaceae bacterium]|nr:tungsten formylmethanofuran dehydrogenase [Bacteroidota bacterium]MCC6257424.1 tungsten formylmethanofuran dehydrogenase [Chitinophagaceae bacterium]MCW5917121.1 tungsten formylmethanofuran dehydrogenase [Ferruginibacter sp.]